LDQKVICAASTGNAASSLSCLSANLNVDTIIFVPEKAPQAKVAQLLVFGSKVVSVKGTYDAAFDLSIKASQEFGWYNRNTGYNPFTREGKKTCAFEICEQLEWETPDKIFVPVGDGNIISGLWKGFLEFKKIGFIEKLPQLIAVQAEKSNAVKLAFEGDGNIKPVSGDTIADSISVSLPRDGMAAVMALKESKGFAISLSDSEIVKAISEFSRKTGVFPEPAAASTYAAFLKAIKENKIDKSESVLLLITGNGLKDVQTAMKSVARKPYLIKPELNELKKIAGELVNQI
jgi:threonine synthase